MGLLGGTLGERCLSPFLIGQGDVDTSLATYSSNLTDITDYTPIEQDELRSMTVMDFGCGYGGVAVELGRLGARTVIGVDVRKPVLDAAERSAQEAGLTHCVFLHAESHELRRWKERVDAVISIDGFEHYGDPEGALEAMASYLRPKGRLYISFGPPWWHPYGAHLQFMTRLPWPHVLFSERLLLDVRGRYKNDGARTFDEVEGGLNQMSVRRFLGLIKGAPFRIVDLQLIPIRGTRALHRILPGGHELFTSTVKACLEKK